MIRRRWRSPAKCTDTVTIELAGHRGHGAVLNVEVEFTLSPEVPATWDDPAEGGEVEITRIRVYQELKCKDGQTTIVYHEIPDWLHELLAECISTTTLAENA